MPRISRRAAGKILLTAPALPVVALAAAQSESQPKPSAFASCIVAAEPSLSGDERARLEKALASLERSLSAIREFKLPDNADPAMQFQPLRSRRRT